MLSAGRMQSLKYEGMSGKLSCLFWGEHGRLHQLETWPEVLEHANGNRVFMMCAAGVRHDIQYMCMCNLLSNERLLRNRFGAQTQGCY